MILIIGGRSQGQDMIARAELGEDAILAYSLEEAIGAPSRSRIILADFNEDIYQRLSDGKDYAGLLDELLASDKTLAILSDEVGLGIVPIEPFERQYREEIGRLQIMLASRADKVIRAICGIGQRLK